MINQIVENEVFIRGMLVGRYKDDDKTTAVICSKSINKENTNYQYVTFFGDLKKLVDSYKICDTVIVKATAWIYRDASKTVNIDNLRLRGTYIELSREFTKRVIAQAGVPVDGIQFKDCVRFYFNGSIVGITESKNQKVHILLGVSEESRKGFNIIPLVFSGKGKEDIENVLKNYKKGMVVSVKGFVSQKGIKEKVNGKERIKYKNTYFITTFLRDTNDFDINDIEVE